MFESHGNRGPEFSDEALDAIEGIEDSDMARNLVRPIAIGNAVTRGSQEVTAADVRDALEHPSLRTKVLQQ